MQTRNRRVQSWHTPGTKWSRAGCESSSMEFHHLHAVTQPQLAQQRCDAGLHGRLARVELRSRSGSWRRPSSPRTAATRRDRRENNREKARAALRRPSIPVASVKVVEALPAWSEYSDRRRGTRVPYARLWRFPCGSREHASTRWYLHCRYCSNLSLPDHLLSAVTGVYTEQGGRPQTRSSYFPRKNAAGRTQSRRRGK